MGTGSNTLRELKMKVVTRNTCRPYAESSGPYEKGFSNFTMTEGMICAGGVVNEGVCHVITSRVKKGQN